MLIARNARVRVLEALADTPVVLVMGARQVGKSTLVRSIAETEHPATVLSLDVANVRESAQRDPHGFVADLDGATVIDEVQRVPDLVLEIKDAVDHDRSSGRFLLTGSANLLRSRRVTETLAGRVDIIRLWPLSQHEIHGGQSRFVDDLLLGQVPRIADAIPGRDAFAEIVAQGGYPEPRVRSSQGRSRWFASYLTATLERDIRDIGDLYRDEELPRLLASLAARSAQPANWTAIARELRLADKTVATYAGLLESIFLVRRIPAWRPSFLQRVLHAPKVYITDTGLLCHLLGVDADRVANDDRVTGLALETFVGMEVIKQADASADPPAVLHYRDRDGGEVDLVLETRAGRVAAIEVKAAQTVTTADIRGIRKIRDHVGENFAAGVVLYTGERTIHLDERIWAVPLSGLWA